MTDIHRGLVARLFPEDTEAWTRMLRRATHGQIEANQLVPQIDVPPSLLSMRSVAGKYQQNPHLPWAAVLRRMDQSLALFMASPEETGPGRVWVAPSVAQLVNILIRMPALGDRAKSEVRACTLAMLDVRRLPDILLNRMATSSAETVRLTTLESAVCPRRAWEAAIRSKDAQELGHAARNTRWVGHPHSGDLVQAMMQEAAARRQLAANPACPLDVLVQLLGSEDGQTRHWASNNPSLPEEYRALIQVNR
jgi:hypothetical protein